MGRDHRGSSSRASNRSSDTNRNTRIPAPKSSSQSSSSSRRPSNRMVINMTTTITTSGAHSGLIVQSGVASAPAPSHHNHRQADPWSLPSVSSPIPSLSAAVPLPIAAPVIEEIAPTTSEDEQHYAPPSHHSVDMPRLMNEPPYENRPSAYQPAPYQPYQSPRFEETEREEEEVSYVDPHDVQLNTFNTNPPPAPVERVSRRDQPMRPDTTSTTTYMEIYREPGDPLHAYQRLALPPNQKPDLLYGPRYEQWANTRTETLIDDRGNGKAVQWKSDLVETDDETAPVIGQTRGRDPSSSPSYVHARTHETRQDMKDGRVIKESISDEDITIETRSAALSPRLFSPSSASGSARIGAGASPAQPQARIGWGAAPAPTPLPIVTSPSIGEGARTLSPMSVDTRYSGVGYGVSPTTRAASRALSPDEYHEVLARRGAARSPSPLRRTAAASPMYAPARAYSPGAEYNAAYARPPPSYRSDSRYDSPPPSQGALDRAKSRSGDIFMLYQTRDALGEIVGHLQDHNATVLSEPQQSSSFSFHAEGPPAAAPAVQQPAAAAASDSPIYATSRIQQADKDFVESAPSSPIYATLQSLQQGTLSESQSAPIHRSRISNPEQAEIIEAPHQSQGPAYVTSHFRLLAKPAAAATAVAVAGSRETQDHSTLKAVQPERTTAAAPDSVIYANLKVQQPTAQEMHTDAQRSPIYAASQHRLPNSATCHDSNKDVAQASSEHSPIYARSQVRPGTAAAAAERTSEASNSLIFAASQVRQPSEAMPSGETAKTTSHSPIYALSRALQHKKVEPSEEKQRSPIYAVSRIVKPQETIGSEDNKHHSPIYAATHFRQQSAETAKSTSHTPSYAVSRAQQPQLSVGSENNKQHSPIYAAPSTIITPPAAAPTETTFEVTLPAAEFGLRLSQLSPRRDSMTQTEVLQPAAPPRPPPPTFARPMHRSASYRQSLPPSVRLRDEHIYDQIPMERETRRHSFTCPPAFISRRNLEKIVHCLNEFPKSKRKSEDFSRSAGEGRLQRSQSMRAPERRPAITRIPVERRPSEDEEEEGPYKNADPRPVRVTIDYDPRYAKVVKPARPPPPRKSLSSSATFAPSSRSIRERSPSKIVRIINGRSYSVDGGRRGRQRPMPGTSPTPPDPRASTAPLPPSIETLPSTRPTSAVLDPPTRVEERREPPPRTKERFDETRDGDDSRGRERSKPPPRPPPPNLLKSAPSESLFVIPARRSRSMSERPSMRAARMPELPEDTDAPAPVPMNTPGISLAAGAYFEPIPVKERATKSTVAVDEPHGEQVPHDSPHATHSAKKATPRQLKRRSQEFDDLISFSDDPIQRPDFLEMAPEPEPEPQIRPVPAPRTTTPTGLGSSPNLSIPDINPSIGTSPTVIVDEHRLRIIGLDDVDMS
ncbi:hypothetical protein PRIPAC_84178 [Pristionchus pacificus]|uniref:Uncharacterized protein n=1 Tax=Pristionchus pacificus TaxID=54126 RepID=A0A2A6CEP0_PRIPA|nr:hypothetical protein PRIPAC_84178 [Pristionchus pacificus]|eukprot:PDM76599.1 hypothetical protein PRIPAC_42965 [Pristionchus pacificus]